MVIMERDSNAPRSGYSAQSYMEALTKGLLPYWRRSHLFMQDGLVYTARVSSNLSSNSITLTLLTGLPIHQTSTLLSTFGGFSKSACTSTIHNTITSARQRKSGRAFVKR
jgi:hypothetical protein